MITLSTYHALLAMLMDELAEREGERYSAENERLKNDPTAEIPPEIRRKALDLIERHTSGGDRMDEYKAPYLHLFNRITEAVAQIDEQNYGSAKQILIKAQWEAEELYISAQNE